MSIIFFVCSAPVSITVVQSDIFLSRDLKVPPSFSFICRTALIFLIVIY